MQIPKLGLPLTGKTNLTHLKDKEHFWFFTGFEGKLMPATVQVLVDLTKFQQQAAQANFLNRNAIL